MEPPAVARLYKSTTGRSIIERALRGAVRLLGAVAPGAVERLAVELFARPRRRRPAPMPAGPGARRLQILFERKALAGWIWGRGPTVLLVHGWEGEAAQLAPFVEPLVRAGHRVVAFDQPAHGRSPGRRANLRQFTAAVLAAGRALGPLHAVVAHSLGGTAAALALADGLAADRVVLLAPPAEVPPFARAVAARLGLDQERTAGMLRRLAREVGPLEALDLRRVAPGLRAPLLLLHDRADREVPFAHGQQVARAWPGASLVELQGLGHRRLLRDATVVDAVVRFLTRPPLAKSA